MESEVSRYFIHGRQTLLKILGRGKRPLDLCYPPAHPKLEECEDGRADGNEDCDKREKDFGCAEDQA